MIIVFLIAVVLVITSFKKGPDNENGDNTAGPNQYTDEYSQRLNETADPAIKEGIKLSYGKCQGEEKPKLGTSPMDSADFSSITPYGLVVGQHVTPIDHQYFDPADRSLGVDSYPVYAMADATIIDIGSRPTGVSGGNLEYRLVFMISCKLFYYYDLLTSLTTEIDELYQQEGMELAIPVKEGQLIGKIGGQTLDFAVWDMDINLDFIVPEHYQLEPWKIHTADPLNYYTDELKDQLLAKYLRTAKPISGKIDHDIDGKLIGNWFMENTNGYTGDYEKYGDYAYGHLSISPDHLDPTATIISIGSWVDGPEQFHAKDEAPNPALVDTSTGLVKYDLMDGEYLTSTGQHWDRQSLGHQLILVATTQTHGCALVQMLADRQLKFESFPGQTCQSVPSFTEQAEIYER